MTPSVMLLILESLYYEHDRKATRLERVGSGTENRVAAEALRWAIEQLTEPLSEDEQKTRSPNGSGPESQGVPQEAITNTTPASVGGGE